MESCTAEADLDDVTLELRSARAQCEPMLRLFKLPGAMVELAVEGFKKFTERVGKNPEDVMPWKVNGERWHLGEYVRCGRRASKSSSHLVSLR